jgi:D-cysteine desulfhydrase
VCELLGLDLRVPQDAVRCVGGYWQPKYSLPNARMVEAVQLLARSEGILLDPVYTGKVMAGLIGLARAGELRAGERVLFLHTGGMPSLFAYQNELRGRVALPP